MQTRSAFETIVMRVLIESVSYTGSAFGSNEKGDIVFFNQRLVEKIGLDMGDVAVAHVIPNYEDKRQETPWRAIRSTIEKDAPLPVQRTPARLDGEVLELLQDTEVSYWTSSDLADASDTDTTTVGNSCLRLFNKGLISKADVHKGPDQDRASFCLWARNSDQFK